MISARFVRLDPAPPAAFPSPDGERRMKMARRRMQWSVAAFLALALTAPGCRRGAGVQPVGPAEPTVRVVRPVERKVTEYVYFTGRTDAGSRSSCSRA